MGIAERDMRRNKARGCYLPVIDWSDVNDPFTGNTDCLTYVFQQEGTRIADIFGSIYFKFISLNDQGTEVPQYLNCGVSLNDIRNDYLALYGERLFSQLYYFDATNSQSTVGNQKSLSKLAKKLKAVLDENYFKYKRLAETLGFIYDPISNYDMTESGTDTKTYSGQESLGHEVDGKKITGVEVFGPLASSTIDTTEGDVRNLTITVDADRKIATDQKGVSDVRAGRAVTTDADGAVGDTVATQQTSPSGTPTTKHYTTTMDSDATGRLQNYDTTEGDTAQSTVSNVETDMPATGRITAGSPNSPSYTDTKSYTNRNDQNVHSLTRRGNIGVTTSQQMIESERQLVRFSLLKEFFEDINKELLLYVWD